MSLFSPSVLNDSCQFPHYRDLNEAIERALIRSKDNTQLNELIKLRSQAEGSKGSR